MWLERKPGFEVIWKVELTELVCNQRLYCRPCYYEGTFHIASVTRQELGNNWISLTEKSSHIFQCEMKYFIESVSLGRFANIWTMHSVHVLVKLHIFPKLRKLIAWKCVIHNLLIPRPNTVLCTSVCCPCIVMTYALSDKALPGDLTLSQLLQILHQRGEQEGHSVLQFSVKFESKKKDNTSQDARKCHHYLPIHFYYFKKNLM